MASIRYLKNRKRWQVRWHITDPATRKVMVSSKLLPHGFTRPDAEREKGKYDKMAREIKLGKAHIAGRVLEAVPRWFQYNRRHTERTQKLYKRVIRRFIDSLPKNMLRVSQISTGHIQDYISRMLEDDRTNRTCNSHLTVIKSFCSWLAEIYHIANVAAGVKMLTANPPNQRFLTPDEFDKVMTTGADNDCFLQRVGFISHTGLRASEFCSLTWANINQDDDGDMVSLTVVGKGRKRRTVPLNDVCQRILTELRNGGGPEDHIFVSVSSKKSQNGQSLGRTAFTQQCNKIAEKAGIPRFGPHALRHWFATKLLLKGVPVAHVSRLMGHGSIKITETTYIHILPDDLAGVTDCLIEDKNNEQDQD